METISEIFFMFIHYLETREVGLFGLTGWVLAIIGISYSMVYKVKYQKEHNERVYKDTLTKTYNRKFLEEELYEMEKANLLTYNVIFADIDHFKRINDTYGHEAGDEVLKYFGNKLINSFKDKDFVVRYGGEEFIIFITNLEDKEVVLKRIEELREEIETNVLNIKGEEIKITSSFGVSAYRKSRKLKEQIDLADRRLYVSKTTGRNKITSEGCEDENDK